MIDVISDKITTHIRNSLDGITEVKAEEINYGLKLMLNEIFIVLILILSSLVFPDKTIKYVIISIITYGSLRIVTGGAHARTRVECTICYIITLVITVFASKYMSANSYLLAILVLIINYTLIYVYAPGDTVEKPILSKKLKKRLRKLSFLVSTIIFAVSLIIWHYDRLVYNIIGLSSLFSIFLLTPLGYKLLRCKQSNNL